MSFSTCIKEVTVFFFQTGVKRKAAPPALQFQPNSAGGKRAKVDAAGQQVKNAVATLNELKQGLVYELVETKGKLFCRERKQFIPPRDSSRTLLRVQSGRQQSNFQRGRKVGSYQSLWCCLSPLPHYARTFKSYKKDLLLCIPTLSQSTGELPGQSNCWKFFMALLH